MSFYFSLFDCWIDPDAIGFGLLSVEGKHGLERSLLHVSLFDEVLIVEVLFCKKWTVIL